MSDDMRCSLGSTLTIGSVTAPQVFGSCLLGILQKLKGFARRKRWVYRLALLIKCKHVRADMGAGTP